MEALVGLMLLLAFLGTLDFSAIFGPKKTATPAAIMEPERDKVRTLR